MRVLLDACMPHRLLIAKRYKQDKKTGEVLARQVILHRKVGGVAGGDEEKGMRNFAEKVVAFAQATLQARGAGTATAKSR